MPQKLVALLSAIALIVSSTLVGCGPSQDNAEFHNNQGVNLSEQGRYNEAVQEFDEAIRLNPEFAEAYYNRGFVYDDLGQFQRAIEDFDAAIRLNPDYETLNNVRRHAQATQVKVNLEYSENIMGISVCDNGKGFKLPKDIGKLAIKGKSGIIGMRERAQFLGCNLNIKSALGKGTSISIEFSPSSIPVDQSTL